jgi:rod shape-determining protein MreD
VRSFLFGPIVRLVPVGLVFLSIQTRVCAPYRPFDVVVQVVLALVVGAGAGGGPERGALAGFVLGMMYDLAVGSPLGLTALAYGLAGLVAGYVITITPDPQWWLAMMFASAGAVVGEASVPVIKLLTGQDGWLTSHLVTVLPVQAVSAAALSPLLIPLGRWCMGAKRRKWKAIPE